MRSSYCFIPRGSFLLLRIFSAACLTLFLSTTGNTADIDDELKVAYIARFTEFIDWPVSAGNQYSPSFTICVFRDHPIQSLLDELPRLMDVDGKPIAINRIDTPENSVNCEILFVPKNENGHLSRIHEYTDKMPVLVINEVPSAQQHGQLISLYQDGERLRIQIHLRDAQASGFKISSRLLKLANVVE